MKRAVVAVVIGTLIVAASVLPADAHGFRHGRHHHHHGHFLPGFLAGAATVLILDALLAPRIVYEPHYYPPGPRYYYRDLICRDVWIPERWELRTQEQNGFLSYYRVHRPGFWRRECY